MIITSTKNEKIKNIEKLKNKNKRDKQNLFLIEGYKEVLIAFENNIKFDSLFICPDFFLKDNEETLIKNIQNQNVSVYECTKDVFQKISYRDRPDGLLAIAKKFKNSLADLKTLLSSKKNPIILVLESIEKPGNLGTILRSSDATNVDAIIVTDPKTDIFNPNVVRASIGTLFTKFVLEEENHNVLKFLNDNNFDIIATTPHTKNIYTDIDLKNKVAIIMGTEQVGLTDFWLKNSNIKVKIPMLGKADSLNVASATTILLYEIQRQRNFK